MTLVDATAIGKCKELRPRMSGAQYLPSWTLSAERIKLLCFLSLLIWQVSPLYQLSLIWVTLFGKYFIICVFQFLICKE